MVEGTADCCTTYGMEVVNTDTGEITAASEASGERILIPNRTSRTPFGAAGLSNCIKKGYVVAQHKNGLQAVITTNCKTWGCKGCRERMKALFKARIEVGCSASEPSMLTTFTYRTVGAKRRSAKSVAADWKALWKTLRTRQRWINVRWLRVIELTKRRQPHLHVVMGPMEGMMRCYGRKFEVARFLAKRGTCGCASHELSEVWRAITGDSWVVHTIPVVGARGAAAYMAKYIAKDMYDRREYVARGYLRRWSSSRGTSDYPGRKWPGTGRIHLREAELGNFTRYDFYYGAPDKEMDNDLEVQERSGDPGTLALLERKKDLRNARSVVKMLQGRGT